MTNHPRSSPLDCYERRALHSLVAAWIGASLTGACQHSSGRGDGGATRAAPEPAQSAPDARAVSYCATLHHAYELQRAQCCGEAPVPLFESQCVLHVSDALRRGALDVDAARLQRCRSAIGQEVQGCAWVTPHRPAAPASCVEALVGQVALGGSCRSSFECSGNAHCVGHSAVESGVCQAPAPTSATCGAGVDVLATYVRAGDWEQTHPPCVGSCSLDTHRCVETTNRLAAEPRLSADGVSCERDADCARGGCVAAAEGTRVCGMKCTADLGVLARKFAAP